MSGPPIQLEYANPLDDQPAGSDAVIESGEGTVTITIPPRGVLSVIWLLLLPVVLLFLVIPLLSTLENQLDAVRRIIVMMLIGAILLGSIFAVVEAIAGASKPTKLIAMRRRLLLHRPSVLRPFAEFKEARDAHLRISMGSPSFDLKGIKLISDLTIVGPTGFYHRLLRQRDKRELLWIKRKLGAVLDQPETEVNGMPAVARKEPTARDLALKHGA